MTNKEAYQLIESCLEYDKGMSENPEAYDEAIRLAKEAFDKQEPVKPIIKLGAPSYYDSMMIERTIAPNEDRKSTRRIKMTEREIRKKSEYQPVTWQEAIQAWAVDGKTVTVLTLFGLGSREVKKSRGSSITEYEIINGVWYVED